MPKGGARVSKFSMPVGRCMGFKRLIILLDELSAKEPASIQDLHESLFIFFGGKRTETCRACIKELWRYGLIYQTVDSSKVIMSKTTWKSSKNSLWHISNLGKFILGLPEEIKSLAFSWLVSQVYIKKKSDQLRLIINKLLSQKIPVNSKKAGIVCGGIDEHGAKVINFGWLEAAGLIYRVDSGKKFKLNKDYLDFLLKCKKIDNALPSIKIHPRIKVMCPETDPIVPDKGNSIECIVLMYNALNADVDLECKFKLNPFFNQRLQIISKGNRIVFGRNKTITIKYNLRVFPQKIAESYMPTQIGTFFVKVNGEQYAYSLPAIDLTTQGDLHERKIVHLLEGIVPKVIPIAHSDRPDAVISPLSHEKNIKKFLSNSDLKILVETTAIGTLDRNKVEMDLDNFIAHTTKVLKINANSTLIIANKLANNLKDKIGGWKKKYKQPFTITTTYVLQRLRTVCNKYKITNWKFIIRFLGFHGLLDEEAFEKILSASKLDFLKD